MLKELASDPARTLIVIDPRRTETAAMADHHLQIRPGGDPFVLTALLAVLVQEDLVDHEFLRDRTNGFDTVRAAFAELSVADYAARAGGSGGAGA